LVDAGRPEVVSVRPNEFRNVKPKILVKDGDTVQLGQPLFHDRNRPEVRFPSPAAGEVVEVRYGRRRVCQQIFIKVAASETAVEHKSWSPGDARKLNRAQLVEAMLDSGLWTSLRQRPFSVIADPEAVPEGIFIAASDNDPLPFDADLALDGREEDFQLGIDLLGKLTEGKVHLCHLRGGGKSRALSGATGCEKHSFSGPYPAGSIEAQIHYVLPYKKGRTVWYLDCQDVAALGEFFRTGAYPVTRVVAVGGEAAVERKHYRTRRGVSADFLQDGKGHLKRKRVVSGSVLGGGKKVTSTGGLGHYDNKFSILPEGDQPEFVGWMLPGFDKVSRFRAYASAPTATKPRSLNTNLGGGVRAHVATGIYEDVCALDILPAHLMKSVLAVDFEEMEALGLHDCAECGLCTFVCPSKIEFGDIIQSGIEEFLKEEEG
ncbi:MAG: NADH:ubiquinone reductase (Na(+)-transporting) subunit A, partial [Gemmatimonadetes bacterium]|nr:NADH:ubiquinone reductase (Na(+)-transporting) subunit A [Gemmatimonadota bacterium]